MDPTTGNLLDELINRACHREVIDAIHGSNAALLVLLGSKSDLPAAQPLLDLLDDVDKLVLVVSAHRNLELIVYLARELKDGVTVLAAGGLSFQLPAVLRAAMNGFGRTNRIFGYPVGEDKDKRRPALEAMSVLPSEMRDSLEVWEEGGLEEFVGRIKGALGEVFDGEPTIVLRDPTRPAEVLSV